MNKFIVFLKRHIKKIIVTIIILIILGVFVYACYRLYKYLTPDTKNSVYGDRCELTDSIDITKEREEMVTEAINKNEGMELTQFKVECNLISLIIIVSDDTKVSAVKEASKGILEVFTEEELKYYDLLIWVDSDAKESEIYPISATRHKTGNGDASAGFVW